MNERIAELRKYFNLSMDAFGSRIGVTRSAISKFENGSNNCSEQTILSICREFNVSEDWLRNGTGEMFVEMSRAELAANIVGSALDTDDGFILNTYIALAQLTPAEWDVIKKFVDKIKTN